MMGWIILALVVALLASFEVSFRIHRKSTGRIISIPQSVALELLAALKEAVSECSCSLHERESGHRIGCPAPIWKDLIAKAEGRNA